MQQTKKRERSASGIQITVINRLLLPLLLPNHQKLLLPLRYLQLLPLLLPNHQMLLLPLLRLHHHHHAPTLPVDILMPQ
jgi:hypothetical protein